MNRHKRLTAIADHVQRIGSITVDEVVERFDISLATARRDLDTLAEQQLLVRTHGGASRALDSASLPVNFRTGRAAEEKGRIAAYAASMISPGAIVGLNGGTTTTQVGRELALATPPSQEGRPSLTVVTNAVNIAYELTVRTSIRVVLTGGVARSHTYEVTGPLAEQFFSSLAIDTLFLGVDGVDGMGAYAADDSEARVNLALAEASRRIVVVADAEKIGKQALARILPGPSIDMVITNASRDTPALKKLARGGTTIVTV